MKKKLLLVIFLCMGMLSVTHYTLLAQPNNNAFEGGTENNPMGRSDGRHVEGSSAKIYSSEEISAVTQAPVAISRGDLAGTARVMTTLYPSDDIVIAEYDVVADYGADKTGVEDATSAINAALTDAYNAGGGVVWLPAGDYKVSDTILVHAFTNLRGDWRDPDTAGSDYGTVIHANLASGINGPTLFRIGGSAGVKGITTYYPNQSASSPVPYNFTFEIPGRAWVGEENYMNGSVINVTMLNSYQGIGISTMASDHGEDVSHGQVHEIATINNVKGTVLKLGATAHNGADVGTWENITFDNGYWANAPAAFNPQEERTLNSWTRANGTAFVFGDVEWEQFYGLTASNYNIGIHTIDGQRIDFAAEFIDVKITDTNTAVQADVADDRWGMSFANSTLVGSNFSVDNNTASSYVKILDCNLSGPTEGLVEIIYPNTCMTGHTRISARPKPASTSLYDVSRDPYNAPSTPPFLGNTLPSWDATAAIQSALNDAAVTGGTVYLPAGWYRIDGTLSVPAGVELRGSSSLPRRDQTGASRGTVLLSYHGHNHSSPDTATALITLSGANAGVRGLGIFYPNNNPNEGMVPYPFAIRGNGGGVYVIDVNFPNAYNGIDFSTHPTAGHYVNKVIGTYASKGIVLGHGGWAVGNLANGNNAYRVGYGIPNWTEEEDVFSALINPIMRANGQFMIIESGNEHMLNNFVYGMKDGYVFTGTGTGEMYNHGIDNVGDAGYGVISSSPLDVLNFMQYNGTPVSGTDVDLYNFMGLPGTQTPFPTPGYTATPVVNIITNGDFEAGAKTSIDGWVEGTNHSWSSSHPKNGSHSLKSTFIGSGTESRLSAPIAIKPNTDYTFSAWIYKTNGDGYASVDMNDIAGEVQLSVPDGAGGGQWTQLIGNWNSSHNTSLTIRAITDGGTSAPIYFDDISLVEVNRVLPTTSGTVSVGAYYYPWYGPNDRHWGEGYVRDFLDVKHPPLLGEYDSHDSSVIDQHLKWGKQYGVTQFITSWWGINSWEDQAVVKMFESEQLGNLDIAILYETPGRLGMDKEQINFDSAAESTLISDFKYLAQKYFNNTNYLKVNGKPVVYLYLTRAFTGNYASVITKLRNTILNDHGFELYLVGDEVFWRNDFPINKTRIASWDAITAYNMHGPPEYAGYPEDTGFLADTEVEYNAFIRIADRLGVDFIPGITPAFNDIGIRPKFNHYNLPHEINASLAGSGQYSLFSESLEMAHRTMDPDLKTIMVTSWNKWNEDSNIEPSIVGADMTNTPNFYTQGYTYEPYGFELLEMIQDFVTTH